MQSEHKQDSSKGAALTREAAGAALARALTKLKGKDAMVLGVPGGGVIVASAIAEHIEAELQLAEPLPPEAHRTRVRASSRMREGDLAQGSMLGRTSSTPAPLAARLDYGANLPEVLGRVVVLVDDGLHSEVGVHELLKAIRVRGARRVILAVPFLSRESKARHASEAEECVTLYLIDSVGDPRAWYEDARSPSEAEVRSLLPKSTPESTPAPAYRRILVPTDFSTSAARAARHAARILEPGGEIYLLHVATIGSESPAEDHIYRALREFWEDTLGDHTDLRLVADRGDPSSKIIELADTASADMIVMGTHGRKGLHRLLIGSVAASVVKDAAVPVLVVPS